MTGVTITVDAHAPSAMLQAVYAAADNVQPMLKNIGEYQAGAIKQRIKDEVSPDGTPFTPLNPFYALTKKGPGILRGASGELARIIWQLAGSSVDIGSTAPYAAAQHFGAVIKPKTAAALVFSLGGNKKVAVKSVTIPPRPFIGFSPADIAAIDEIAEDHFMKPATSMSGAD